ncbi:Ternary complex factor MIP1 leucine-zipper-containing protein [Dioscorea alata]|uniref:Ternary complex factor MIP1 leucine-zipper-containing protein n=1 Tax=Dioscorea alata TaxID=55571 RepID=A0ACB7WQ96_DIOAL|nr:Ternary complex factor MIP1 leucine-zipper-containing protein [Dioscorea alata]
MSLIAQANHASTTIVPNTKKRFEVGGEKRRVQLEQEKMLENEEKVHQVLERALLPCANGTMLQIPSFLPKKAKELLAELVMVEEEIARLEGEIGKIQQNISDERELQTKYRRKGDDDDKLDHMSASIMSQAFDQHAASFNQSSRISSFHEKVTMETKPMFFINQAINGGYIMHGFNSKVKKEIAEKKENQNFRGLKKSEIVVENQSSPKLLPRQHITKDSADNLAKKSNLNLQANKLSESIMKCLICVFLRLLRTTRTLEIEKSGNLSRSLPSSILSRSLRIEGGLNTKTSQTIQKELGQKDPYGVFEIEDSIIRDIGPYKNLVQFTTSSLDLKGISTSLPLLKKLRGLLNNLEEVDLRFLNHQQKLAFWINMYNTCIMHGFLEHGLPSDPEKILALRNKAVLNIGGNKLNALAIEHLILRQPSNIKEAKDNKDENEDSIQSMSALEHSEPNIIFALCVGNKFSPAVRIYTAEGVISELEKAKLEYLQASIVVTSTRKLMIPKLLVLNMRELAKGLDSLVEWICNQLPTSGSLRKSIVECLRGHINGKISDVVGVIPCDMEFQYLLPK